MTNLHRRIERRIGWVFGIQRNYTSAEDYRLIVRVGSRNGRFVMFEVGVAGRYFYATPEVKA